MLRTVRFMACRAARATACVNPRIPARIPARMLARMIAHAAAQIVAPEFSSTLCVFVHAMLLRHRVTPVREPLGPRFPCSSRLDPLVPLRPARRSTSKPRSLRTSRHSSCPSVPPPLPAAVAHPVGARGSARAIAPPTSRNAPSPSGTAEPLVTAGLDPIARIPHIAPSHPRVPWTRFLWTRPAAAARQLALDTALARHCKVHAVPGRRATIPRTRVHHFSRPSIRFGNRPTEQTRGARRVGILPSSRQHNLLCGQPVACHGATWTALRAPAPAWSAARQNPKRAPPARTQ
jgi:hypothetical protein